MDVVLGPVQGGKRVHEARLKREAHPHRPRRPAIGQGRIATVALVRLALQPSNRPVRGGLGDPHPHLGQPVQGRDLSLDQPPRRVRLGGGRRINGGGRGVQHGT